MAEAQCIELRVGLSTPLSLAYKNAEARKKIRIAAENPRKLEVVAELLNRHVDDKVLIIGMYLDQLEQVAKLFNAPLITGKTPNPQRDELYGRFRRGEIRVLTVSKVANFSIDLPDANVAIQSHHSGNWLLLGNAS